MINNKITMFDYIKTISPAQYKKHNVEKELEGMRKNHS